MDEEPEGPRRQETEAESPRHRVCTVFRDEGKACFAAEAGAVRIFVQVLRHYLTSERVRTLAREEQEGFEVAEASADRQEPI